MSIDVAVRPTRSGSDLRRETEERIGRIRAKRAEEERRRRLEEIEADMTETVLQLRAL